MSEFDASSCESFMKLGLTVLNGAFPLRHVLKVVYDGACGQMVKGLVPQLLVNLLLAFPPLQEGLDVKEHLPLDRLSTEQT